MPLDPLTTYDATLDPTGSQLVASFVTPNSGIEVVQGSVNLSASAASAVSLYDGSLALGIGSGLLLTSGTAPGFSNTMGWFGTDNTQYLPDGTPISYDNGSAAIDAVVNTVFQTQSFDATTLSFEFTVTDPTATSISFDIIFGSEEYPEWVDQFVDCAVVIVNGVNYAYFAHDTSAPLSVIGPNLAAGYFQDNSGNILPIEYDGISKSMTIVAPIIPGVVNSVQIGIADTGDHVYDSGIFIANMTAGKIPGSGVVLTPDVPCTSGDDIVTGTVSDELINLLDGNDTAYAGGGDDIIIAGGGDDKVYGGSGNDVLEGDDGNDVLDGGEGTGNTAIYTGNSTDYQVNFDVVSGKYNVAGAEGADTLANIQLIKFADGIFDLTESGLVIHTNNTQTSENIAGSVVVSGAALVGQTLTALVFDANGLPNGNGAVAFKWMTSLDGVNWTDTQVASNTYKLGEQDLGLQLKVDVSYTDNANFVEVPSSLPVEIKAKNDLAISLIQITAPAGSGVENPLTTLLANAISVGFSASLATIAIKAALGLPDIDLKTYDPVAILATTPTDATALAVLKVCGELAMAISASDPTGFNLTLSVLDASANGKVLNLADPDQLLGLLSGIGATEIDIVQTTTKDMDDASGINGIMAAWNDFCGNTDGMEQYKDTFIHFNGHLNQGPTGYSTATLDFGSVDTAYTITAQDLLLGFSDPDGDFLTVVDLAANFGGSFSDNGDGSWTFSPDAGFIGAVELSYLVSDPSGKTAAGTNMLVIAAATEDVTAPAVSAISYGTNDGTLMAGETVTLTVSLTEAVIVTGAPTLALANGGTATYLAGTGTSQLTFEYTVAAGQDAVDLVTAASASLTGSITDLAGNPLAADAFDALNPTGTLVIDTIAPTVATFSPTDGATLVGVNTAIVLNFSEAISSGSGQIMLRSGSTDGPLVESFDVLSASNMLISGTTLTLMPSSPLAYATTYYVVFGAGCLTDGAGNAYGGTSVYDFRTAPAGNLILGTTDADNLSGSANVDIILGQAGDDTLTGAAGIDLLDGGEGSDIYILSTAAEHGAAEFSDTGISGSDQVRFAAVTASTLTLYAADTGIENVVVGTGSGATPVTTGTVALNVNASAAANGLTITGNAGINTLTGSGYSDTIDGGLGNDSLIGGAGNDRLDGGAGNDVLMGGDGVDTASYASATAGVTVSLALATAQNTGGAGTDTLTTFENLLGSGFNDILTGATTANQIDGSAGNDTITGAVGADTLLGGDGDDLFIVGLAADFATGEVITGGNGTDELRFTSATASTLTLTSGVAVERVVIGTGTAAAAVGTAKTAININAAALTGAVAMIGNAGVNALTSGSANDILDGGGGNDSLTGGAGADTFTVGAGVDTITDLNGLDVLTVASGATANATVTSAWTATSASANSGSANLTSAGYGVDLSAITTGTAGFKVTNTGGAASFTGASLADTLLGGTGNDTLIGGAGNDSLTGGTGTDSFIVGTGTDVITDLSVSDVLTVATGATASATVSAAWTATSGTTNAGTTSLTTAGLAVNLSGVTGGSAGFTVTNTASTATTLTGSKFGDTLTGGSGADTLIGGDGNDSLAGGAGNDTFTIALGTDSIKDLSSADVVSVASGATLNGTVSAAWTATVGTTNAGTANLTTAGFAVNLAAVTGGSAGYSVTNTAATAATLTGSKFNDTLTGGAGADTLVGGLGNDSLTGGAGNDTFTVASGADSITDLSAGDIFTVAAGATANATVTAAWTATTGTTNAGTATLSTNGLAVNLAAVTGGTVGYNVTNTGAATTLTGSKFADTLTGGTGDDTLVGGAGADSLIGNDGNDLFVVALTADFATGEVITGGNGTDELRFTTTAASTLTLTSGVAVERVVIGTGTAAAAVSTATTAININAAAMTGAVTLIGNAGINTLTGSAYNDSLDGGAGNDRLTGGAGADTLVGGLGNDSLTGGLGADVFVFNTAPNASSNKDTITDFSAADDDIWLSKAVMAGLGSGTGALSADAFWGGAGITASHDASDRIIYNQTTGALYYDADGNGTTAAIQIGQLTAGTALTAADVFII